MWHRLLYSGAQCSVVGVSCARSGAEDRGAGNNRSWHWPRSAPLYKTEDVAGLGGDHGQFVIPRFQDTIYIQLSFGYDLISFTFYVAEGRKEFALSKGSHENLLGSDVTKNLCAD